jgi:hypothetical protein
MGEELLAEIGWYEFDDRGVRRSVDRYFADRAELVAQCRSHVDDLLGRGAADRGKSR